MTRSGLAYEVQTLALPTDATGGSASEFLLPSPSAQESTPTEEFVEEVRENLHDPHKRLYLKGRKWHSQRTLSRIAPALLPTPSAWLGRRPENAMADPERAKSRENEGERGKRSVELPDAIAAEVRLLPTPTRRDEKGPNPNHREGGEDLPTAVKLLPTPVASDAAAGGSRNLEGSKAHAGVSLTDAVRFGNSNTPRKLLPTPIAGDGEGGRTSKGADRPDEAGLRVTVERLLPTPMSNEENPGAGGELRAAITHGPERRNRTGTDSWGRPNRGRSSGEPTDPPSSDGSASSDEPLPGQLTISDGSTLASPSGCSDTPTDGSRSTE
jgi:hypothetical protein